MQTYKKILVVVLIALITPVLYERSKENKKISLKIERMISDQNFTSIDASKLSTKTWDKLCVLGPYASAYGFEREAGFNWNVELYTSWDSEDFTLLTFIKDNSVVEFAEYPILKNSFINGCKANNKLFLNIKRSKNGPTFHEMELVNKD